MNAVKADGEARRRDIVSPRGVASLGGRGPGFHIYSDRSPHSRSRITYACDSLCTRSKQRSSSQNGRADITAQVPGEDLPSVAEVSMNLAHVHLVLNHVPVIGVAFASLLLLYGI